ncbi:hypothetical protein ACRRTK_015887 [Alexandromys fortis]
MYACSRFISTRSLVRSTSQLLSHPLSAVELNPQTRKDEEQFSEATALLLRHSGLFPLRGHGALLPNGGLSHPLRHVTQLSPLHLP